MLQLNLAEVEEPIRNRVADSGLIQLELSELVKPYFDILTLIATSKSLMCTSSRPFYKLGCIPQP